MFDQKFTSFIFSSTEFFHQPFAVICSEMSQLAWWRLVGMQQMVLSCAASSCAFSSLPSTVTVKRCVVDPWLLKARHSYSPSSSRVILSKCSQRSKLSCWPVVSSRLLYFFVHSTCGVGLQTERRMKEESRHSRAEREGCDCKTLMTSYGRAMDRDESVQRNIEEIKS